MHGNQKSAFECTREVLVKGLEDTIQEVPSKTAGKSYNVYGTVAQV